MNKLVVVVVALIMVFAGLIAYHIYNEPADQHFYLHMHILNSTAIGNFSIGSYHYDIKYPWFNTTMAGYNNYTIQFQNYIAYNNISNKTAHLYLVKNTTFTFSPPPLWYVPINITNTNDTATPTNFQTMVKINWSAYSKYLLPSLSNVRFYNSTSFILSHELAAWMENNNTLQAHSSNVWINMSGTVIAGKSSVKIYMLFGPSTENFGKHWGEAPQLSPTYGQYDNGVKVFLKYWNFAGTSLPTGWTINDGGTVTVDNGVSVYADSSGFWNRGGLGYNNPIASPYVVETWMKDDAGINDGNLAIFPFVPSDITTSNTYTTLYLEESFDGWVWQNPNGTMNTNGNYKTNINGVYALYGYAVNVSKATESVNYGSSTPVESGYTSTTYIGFASYTNTMYASWVRVRAYPPGGTMPTSQFLSPVLSNILTSSPVYLGPIYLE